MNAQKSLFHDQTPTIDEVMGAWRGDKSPEWLSRAMIAERLGRSKSPTLIGVLGACMGMGYLTIKNERLPNGADYYLYQPTQKWWSTDFPF